MITEVEANHLSLFRLPSFKHSFILENNEIYQVLVRWTHKLSNKRFQLIF